MAVIGGFLFGYDTGVVSSAMLFIPQALGLDYTWQQLVISVTLASCAVFSLVAGGVGDRFGRRPTILAASALFSVGALLMAASLNRYMLLAGRVIVGAAIGSASMIVPTYVAESCPAHVRGRMLTGFQLMITFGVFCASVLGALFSYVPDFGWRLMMGFAALPSLVQFVGFLFLPESPRWLLGRGRDVEARNVLERIYGAGSPWIDVEMSEISEYNRRAAEEQEKTATGGGGLTIVAMLKTGHVRRALLVGCALQALPQLSGVNSITYYTATVVKMGGVRRATTAIWLSCTVMGVNFFMTFLPLSLVDRWGRRRFLLASTAGVLVALLLLSGGFFLINRTSPTAADRFNTTGAGLSDHVVSAVQFCSAHTNCDACVTLEGCGFCFATDAASSANKSYGACVPSALGHSERSLVGACSNTSMTDIDHGQWTWAWNYCQSSYSLLPIIGMILYLTAFSQGMGPMPWVMNAEIYPNWARATGVAIATAMNWTFNLLVSQTFLYLTEALEKYGAFLVYAVFCAIALLVFWIWVPETKGLPVEEMEQLFMRRKSRSHVTPTLPHAIDRAGK